MKRSDAHPGKRLYSIDEACRLPRANPWGGARDDMGRQDSRRQVRSAHPCRCKGPRQPDRAAQGGYPLVMGSEFSTVPTASATGRLYGQANGEQIWDPEGGRPHLPIYRMTRKTLRLATPGNGYVRRTPTQASDCTASTKQQTTSGTPGAVREMIWAGWPGSIRSFPPSSSHGLCYCSLIEHAQANG